MYAEFSYNNSTHSSTGHSPFLLMHGFHPRTPHTFHHEQQVQDASVMDFLSRQHCARVHAHFCLTQARARQKYHADQHRRAAPSFRLGDLVLVHARPYALSDHPKLDDRWIGPYAVSKVHDDGLSYRLDLDDGSQIHPVFHVSQLKRYEPAVDPHPSSVRANPPWLHDPDAPVYEAILSHFRGRGRGGPLHYRVKCLGKPDPIDIKAQTLLDHDPTLIRKYEADHPEVPRLSTATPLTTPDL